MTWTFYERHWRLYPTQSRNAHYPPRQQAAALSYSGRHSAGYFISTHYDRSDNHVERVEDEKQASLYEIATKELMGSLSGKLAEVGFQSKHRVQ